MLVLEVGGPDKWDKLPCPKKFNIMVILGFSSGGSMTGATRGLVVEVMGTPRAWLLMNALQMYRPQKYRHALARTHHDKLSFAC